MKIAISSDHGAFALKGALVVYLKQNGYEVTDFGTYDAQSCDYPDFALPVAESVAQGKFDKGIVLCTTGIGVSIVANKVDGVRCALCRTTDEATLCRQHNDANVLALGAKYTNLSNAVEIVDKFLNTPFEGGRHAKRVEKITLIERGRK